MVLEASATRVQGQLVLGAPWAEMQVCTSAESWDRTSGGLGQNFPKWLLNINWPLWCQVGRFPKLCSWHWLLCLEVGWVEWPEHVCPKILHVSCKEYWGIQWLHWVAYRRKYFEMCLDTIYLATWTSSCILMADKSSLQWLKPPKTPSSVTNLTGWVQIIFLCLLFFLITEQ